MDQRAAFSRAWGFLSYNPLAKWSAMISAVGTAVLYVAILVVLALFADLMVNRGLFPRFADLAPGQQTDFLDEWSAVQDRKVRKDRLTAIAVEDGRAEAMAATEPAQLSKEDREVVWRAHTYQLLRSRAGEDAARTVTERSPDMDLPPRGILPLVVRTNNVYGHLAGGVAWVNPWMWKYGEGEQVNYLYMTGLLLLALVLLALRSVLLFVMSYMAARATMEATVRLRRALYHHTFRLGTLAIRALGPSEAVSLATRHVEAIHDGLYARLTVLIREPVKIGLLIVFALLVNPALGLAFLLFALLIWLIGGQIVAYFRDQGRRATHRAAGHLALMQESLMMMRLVKVYLMELFSQARVERQLAEYTRSNLRRYRGEAIYRPVLVFLGSLAALVLLYIAGLIVLNGQIGVTNAIVLVVALASLYWPIRNWLENRRVVRRARESAAVVFQFLDRPGEVGQVVGAEFLPPLQRRIEFDDVSLKEPGSERLLLRNVSLTIKAGQRVGLVGPDDAEKYALVYLLPRFLDPAAGEIRVDEHNLRWVTLDSLRAQMAMVMQHNLVFNDTVANNISCGDTGYTLPQVIEAAKVAHAHHFIQKLPQGYETPIGEMGQALNPGQQFRVGLARAILRDPSILIIEEPPVAMDEETKSLLDDTFARVLPGRTVIFLPHRISTIRSCDQVFLLNKGQIEAAGIHRELLQQNELYQHLHYLEFNMFAGQI